MRTAREIPATDSAARERLLSVAYDLFAQRGIRDVSIDEIVSRSGVARATLYRHFKSKEELAVAFLERREQRWTFGAVEAEARRRGSTAEERLLAIFDVFHEWFNRDDGRDEGSGDIELLGNWPWRRGCRYGWTVSAGVS